jgi:15-cis-phytoene synthase
MNDVQTIALAYAPRRCREGLSALWELDAALGRMVATTTEPMIGQMRLTWWHERLTALDTDQVPAEPLLQSLHDVVRRHDVTGAGLAELVEGWELLLDPFPLEADILSGYAEKRGDKLFALSARIIGAPVSTGAGAGWAMIDFAAHCSDTATAERAWTLAATLFANSDLRAPKTLRILARIARAKANQTFDEIGLPVSRLTLLKAVLW